MTENKITTEIALHCIKAQICEELCEECPYYGTTGTDHCEKDALHMAIQALDEIQQYREIGTLDECREAVERMKAMNTNESIITIGLYFEIHDADIYGGKGTIGYANTNVELKVSALAKADMSNYVEMQRQGVAEMCGVAKEKVIVISRTDYEEETADEEDYDEDDYF